MDTSLRRVLTWACLTWAFLFIGYYSICMIFYYANHAQEDHDALIAEYHNDKHGYFKKFPERQWKILTFKRIEVSK